jgi:HEAT repeat protein
MAEEAEYIRKNLGPFAIGDGLLSRFPEQVLAACGKWVKSKDANVRWNVAMIFTAAAAKKFAADGKVLLKVLENDPDPMVLRAAKKAARLIKV